MSWAMAFVAVGGLGLGWFKHRRRMGARDPGAARAALAAVRGAAGGPRRRSRARMAGGGAHRRRAGPGGAGARRPRCRPPRPAGDGAPAGGRHRRAARAGRRDVGAARMAGRPARPGRDVRRRPGDPRRSGAVGAGARQPRRQRPRARDGRRGAVGVGRGPVRAPQRVRRRLGPAGAARDAAPAGAWGRGSRGRGLAIASEIVRRRARPAGELAAGSRGLPDDARAAAAGGRRGRRGAGALTASQRAQAQPLHVWRWAARPAPADPEGLRWGGTVQPLRRRP